MKQIIAGQLEACAISGSAIRLTRQSICPIKGGLCPQLIWLSPRPNVDLKLVNISQNTSCQDGVMGNFMQELYFCLS